MLKQEKLLFKELIAVNYRPIHVRESITQYKGIPDSRHCIPVFFSRTWILDSNP